MNLLQQLQLRLCVQGSNTKVLRQQGVAAVDLLLAVPRTWATLWALHEEQAEMHMHLILHSLRRPMWWQARIGQLGSGCGSAQGCGGFCCQAGVCSPCLASSAGPFTARQDQAALVSLEQA